MKKNLVEKDRLVYRWFMELFVQQRDVGAVDKLLAEMKHFSLPLDKKMYNVLLSLYQSE
jgi:hypothetical protein